MGQADRVAEQRQQNRCPQPDTRGRSCDGRQEGQRFAARTCQERIAHPHGVEAGLFGMPGSADEKGKVAVCPQQGFAGRKQEAGGAKRLTHGYAGRLSERNRSQLVPMIPSTCAALKCLRSLR